MSKFDIRNWIGQYVAVGLVMLFAVGVGIVHGQFDGFGGGGDEAVVDVKVVGQYDWVGVEQAAAIAVELTVKSGWHLYANPKGGELGIDTEITPSGDGVVFGKVIYPKGEFYEDKTLGATNYIYEDAIIYVPVKGSAAGKQTITFAMKGLTCSEDGTCLPWNDNASFVLDVRDEAGHGAVKSEALFKGFDGGRVVWNDGEAAKAVDVTETVVEPEGDAVVMPDYQPVEYSGGEAKSWVWMLVLAVAAGFLMNLMPCVLPVIPIKVLSLIQQSQSDVDSGDKYKAVKLSAVFSAGILLVFVGLAIVMSVFKVLYGQQFQSDEFKLVMLMIIYVLALSMFGVFEVAVPTKLNNISVVKDGYLGALGMGVLATLLATPCSAPLLGPVLTWSLSKPTAVTIGVFIVIGIGMAAPYVILTAFPSALHRLPKAGQWMIYLKQGLGFVMLAVAAYLIFLFQGVWHLPLIAFCLVVGFALWLSFTVVGLSTPSGKKAVVRLIALVLVVASGWGVLLPAWKNANAINATNNDVAKVNWLVTELKAAHDAGQTVMVEFTADWCPNCKYVEQTVLKKDAFKDALEKTNTKLIIADWTHYDVAITAVLEKLGSKSIPFSAVFAGDDPLRPTVVRDIYTLDTILDVLETAKNK